MNLWILFLTGLTTGGITCMAMQGGLLAGIIAQQARETTSKQVVWYSILGFLITKLTVHVMLGFGLGILGSVITLSLGTKLFFQVLAALFMAATAAHLLELHPIFRWVAFQPPRFLTRVIFRSSKSRHLFAPVFLGALTIFIPCGVTQAVEVLALATGNSLQSALMMGVFVLGTFPLFATIGLLTSGAAEQFQQRFARGAAVLLVLMSLWSINGVLVVLNAPITAQKILSPVVWFFSEDRFAPISQDTAKPGVQQLSLEVKNTGYSPQTLTAYAGSPVELTLRSNQTYSCALSFVLPAFGISVDLQPTDRKVVRFTPTQPGTYTFSCNMGMYTGTLHIL